MSAAPNLLLVEPDVDLARTLAFLLESHGFAVRVASSAAEAVAGLQRGPLTNMVLTEVDLPDGRGFDLCARIRADGRNHEALVCFLTGRAEEIDRVVAFEVGADDYVTKPFSVRELLLRLRALLRRTRAGLGEVGVVVHGRLEVDATRRRAMVAGRDAGLSPIELRVLHLLASHPENVFDRPAIVAAVWGAAERVQVRTVDCVIKRVRRKLGAEARALETVHGVGFRWRQRALASM